jgi:hypothetical protein
MSTKVKDFLERNKDHTWNAWYGLPMSHEGIWRICGEDPNCDFGGSHHNPYLATVEGTLEEAIEYAVELPRFWTWGRGGTIDLIDIVKLDAESSARRKFNAKRIKDLEEELNNLKNSKY